MNGFPNMAGKPDIDDALAAELEAAGIHAGRYPFLKNEKHEVDTSVRGDLHGWRFERAWYYWRCSGPGIEVAAAERLHAEHGKDVRVAGHCGCPSPTEWYDGLAVGDYHVDTPAGLKALADTIKSLVECAKQPGRSATAPTSQAVEAYARELLAKEYDVGGRDGPYPSYAALARDPKHTGSFTMCSIRAVMTALSHAAGVDEVEKIIRGHVWPDENGRLQGVAEAARALLAKFKMEGR